MATRRKGRSRTLTEHKRRSRAAKKAIRHRKRDAMGHLMNPMSYDNPFLDKRGRRHRNDGPFAKRPGPKPKKRSARRRARHNPFEVLANPFMNPFYDKVGRRHRNDGPFARRPGPKPKKRRSRRARSNPSPFMSMMALANPFMAALPNPSRRRKSSSKKTSKTSKTSKKAGRKTSHKRKAAPKRRKKGISTRVAKLLAHGQRGRGAKRARMAPFGMASHPFAGTQIMSNPHRGMLFLPAPRRSRRRR